MVGELISRTAGSPRPLTYLPRGRFVAVNAAEHQHSILVAPSDRLAAIEAVPAGGADAISAAGYIGSWMARDEGTERSALWLERVCGGARTEKAEQTRDKSGNSLRAKHECRAMHEDKPTRVLRDGQYQGRVVARHQAVADSVSSVRRVSTRRTGEPALGVMGGHLSAGVLTGAAPGVVAFGLSSSSTTAPAPTGDVVAKGCVALSQSSSSIAVDTRSISTAWGAVEDLPGAGPEA
jgi:hypothetical protein